MENKNNFQIKLHSIFNKTLSSRLIGKTAFEDVFDAISLREFVSCPFCNQYLRGETCSCAEFNVQLFRLKKELSAKSVSAGDPTVGYVENIKLFKDIKTAKTIVRDPKFELFINAHQQRGFEISLATLEDAQLEFYVRKTGEKTVEQIILKGLDTPPEETIYIYNSEKIIVANPGPRRMGNYHFETKYDIVKKMPISAYLKELQNAP